MRSVHLNTEDITWIPVLNYLSCFALRATNEFVVSAQTSNSVKYVTVIVAYRVVKACSCKLLYNPIAAGEWNT